MLPENAAGTAVFAPAGQRRERELQRSQGLGVLRTSKATVLIEFHPEDANLDHVLDKRPVGLLASVAVDRTVLPLDIKACALSPTAGRVAGLVGDVVATMICSSVTTDGTRN